MKEITQIRKLSLWIFFIPLVAINLCLIISQNYQYLENTIFTVDMIGRSYFSIPYIDGSLSISRASRTYPQYLIFKPSMIVTAVLLFYYYKKENVPSVGPRQCLQSCSRLLLLQQRPLSHFKGFIQFLQNFQPATTRAVLSLLIIFYTDRVLFQSEEDKSACRSTYKNSRTSCDDRSSDDFVFNQQLLKIPNGHVYE